MFKPTLNTKVRITIDNSYHKNVRTGWAPDVIVIEGTVYYSNAWDDEDSIRLTAPNHSILHPVIAMHNILNIEVLGEDNSPLPPDQPVIQIKKPTAVVYKIESSKGDTFYDVVKDNGKWSCSCIANQRGKLCRHIKQAQELEAKPTSS